MDVALLATLLVVVAFMGWMAWRQQDHMQRMERRSMGMPEAPKLDRKHIRETIPDDIQKLIQPWSSAATRQYLRQQCHELRQEGYSWKDIHALLKEQTPDVASS